MFFNLLIQENSENSPEKSKKRAFLPFFHTLLKIRRSGIAGFANSHFAYFSVFRIDPS